MLKSNNLYTLRTEEAEGIIHYFVLFKDGPFDTSNFGESVSGHAW